MSRNRRRIAVAVMSVALLLGAPILTACGNAVEGALENAAGDAIGGDVDISDDSLSVTSSDGTQMQIGENISIPDTWPGDVPLYEGGKLQTVTVSGDASQASAMWQTDQAAEDAVAAYSSQIVGAGFTAGQVNNMGGVNTADFTGSGYSVTIMAIAVDGGATTLTVVAEKE